jgi:hypothetical protein
MMTMFRSDQQAGTRRRSRLRRSVLAAVVTAGVMMGAVAAPQAANAAAGDPIYTLDKSAGSTLSDRWSLFAPLYVVFSDAKTAAEAEAVVADLEIAQHLEDYKTKVLVMAPVDGSTWDAEADLANYQALVTKLASSYSLNNTKVIGIGTGATFVNNVISQNAYSIAGIYTYGGTIDAGLTPQTSVPTYVHSADAGVSSYYISANSASSSEESDTFTTYANPAANKSLERVVVSKLDNAQESVAAGFQTAWTTVFSKNYRFYMDETEFYSATFNPLTFSTPWELATYPIYDELGINVSSVQGNLTAAGTNQWYEYVPRRLANAEAKTIPLVVMLHGNGNDNRTQAETSGWPELAATEDIMLVAPEWQGGAGFTGLREAGTMALLDLLFEKYPQIDPSRVYLTGLSAGALSSYSFGINNVKKIAAIAGSSAPNGNPALITAATNVKTPGNYLPMYSILGTKDMYHPIPVGSFYNTIRAFAVLNDLTVEPTADLAKNELFGTYLDGQAWTELAGKPAMIGTLSNEQGVMMKLVGLDPYGHWNFKPAAADIWAFLSQYSRDLDTGRLSVALGGLSTPAGGGDTWNTVKGGSTVPLKFEVFSGDTELTSTSAVSDVSVLAVSCTTGAPTGAAALTVEGNGLRYDSAAGQFVQNWKTPKNPGACYQVVIRTQVGTTLGGFFRLK